MGKELKALKKFIEKLKADIKKEEKIPAYGYHDNDYKDGKISGMELVLEDLERLLYNDFDE